jgi:HAD superfamily hydrolase (TIGR01509 family)
MTILPPHWPSINTVLLDMDGTLLDKHFDDHFWEKYVPSQYAVLHRITVDEAEEKLMQLYRTQEETLNWTDLDYWSRQLGLDIPALKKQVDHLISVHPNVVPFLDAVRRRGKRICLVTNAHGKTLDLKMEKTALAGLFHDIVTSHEIGMPKEEPRFWEGLRQRIHFEPHRTLLAEDTEAVLVSAAAYGITYLIHIAKSSSAKPARLSDRFYSVETFGEIMPENDSAQGAGRRTRKETE